MSLPAAVRHRWNLEAGGPVEVLDLGVGVLMVPVGEARAQRGPPSFPVRSTLAVRQPVFAADTMRSGATLSSINLARLNISNSPSEPTSPHVR